MPRLAPAVLLLALAALAPAAEAQLPGPTVAITLDDLPSEVATNGTLASLPFQVSVTVSSAACPGALVGGGNTYEVELRAAVANSTGDFTTAVVSPGILSVSGPGVLSTGGSSTRTETANLVVSPGPYNGTLLGATVVVTASYAGGGGACTGQEPAPAAQASQEVDFTFEPVSGYGEPASQVEMPGPGLAAAALALAGAALIARRRR